MQGLAGVGGAQDLEAEDPGSGVASSVTLEVTSPPQASFPYVQAVC